jgi:hypothetical protein
MRHETRRCAVHATTTSITLRLDDKNYHIGTYDGTCTEIGHAQLDKQAEGPPDYRGGFSTLVEL